MRRHILVMALGATLAVAGLAIGSDTSTRASGDCVGPCVPCPFPCAADNAAMATSGSCPLPCASAVTD